MYYRMVLFSIFFLLLSKKSACQIHPGITGRINKAGFIHVKDIVVDFLTSHFKTIKIPDIWGTKPFHFSVKNIKIEDFDSGEQYFRPTAPNLATAGICHADLTVSATWSNSLKLIALVKDIEISLNVTLGVGDDGKPTFTPGDCVTKVGKFSLKPKTFAGFYGLIFSVAQQRVKEMFEKQIICPTLKREVEIFSNEYHKHANVYFSFFLGTIIDLNLVQDIKADSESVSLFMNGKISPIYRSKNISSLEDFCAQTSSVLQAHVQMIQASVEQCVFNTFLDSLHQNGLFRLINSLEEILDLLGLTSSQDIFEEMEMFPHTFQRSEVVCRTNFLKPPEAYLTMDSILLKGSWQSLCAVPVENDRDVEICGIGGSVLLTGNLSLNDHSASVTLHGIRISNFRFSNLRRSFAISSLEALQSKRFLTSSNSFLRKGVSLPDFFSSLFRNLSFIHAEERIELAMDFKV